jgi:hypothetical protein
LQNDALNSFNPSNPYLYVITNAELFQNLSGQLTVTDGFGVVDGQMVIAPGWFAQAAPAASPLQRGRLPAATKPDR